MVEYRKILTISFDRTYAKESEGECNPMNILVLCGGMTPERDVSIRSGRQIADSLIQRGHRVCIMDLFFGYTKPYNHPLDVFDNDLSAVPDTLTTKAPDLAAVRASRPDGGERNIGENVYDLCRAADIVFLALHGEDGENGKLQAAFDLEGIRYTGTDTLGSALAMHKGVSRTLFEHVGIAVAPGILVRAADVFTWDTFPCVVKPCSGGSSVATTIVTHTDDLQAALKQVFEWESEALIESFIPGREFSVGVLADEALPVIEICPKSGFYDYENKYQAGLADEICPAELSHKDTRRLQEAALLAHHALHLKVYSRTDFILTAEGTIYCLESNTLPGMTPTSLLPQEAHAAGLPFADLCEKIIAVSMEKYL